MCFLTCWAFLDLAVARLRAEEYYYASVGLLLAQTNRWDAKGPTLRTEVGGRAVDPRDAAFDPNLLLVPKAIPPPLGVISASR